MSITRELIEIERDAYFNVGTKSLTDVYRILKDYWENGDRGRELCLHLFFLSWYGIIEPPFIFGETNSSDKLMETFHFVTEYLEDGIDSDPELLYVIGLTSQMFGFMFGDADEWDGKAIDYRGKYRNLLPDGLDPKVFADRGAYGKYYEEMAAIKDGF